MGSSCSCVKRPEVCALAEKPNSAPGDSFVGEEIVVPAGAAASSASRDRRMSGEDANKLEKPGTSDSKMEGPTEVSQKDGTNLEKPTVVPPEDGTNLDDDGDSDSMGEAPTEGSQGITSKSNIAEVIAPNRKDSGESTEAGEDNGSKEPAMGKTPSHVAFRPEQDEVREFTVTRDPNGKHAPKSKSDEVIKRAPDEKSVLSGYVWKLNASVAYKDSKDMANISSWRQRVIVAVHFSRTGKVVLNYMSEKENGAEALFGVLLSGSTGVPAKLTKLASVRLAAMSTELHHHVAVDMYEYDKAINKKSARHRHVEKYEAEIPKMLHPILISWKDDQRKTIEHVVALESQDDRRNWMRALQAAMGQR